MNNYSSDDVLTYEAFKEHVEANIRKYISDDIETVRILPIEKNHMTLDGLTLHTAGSNVSPTIYLDAIYSRYRAGQDLNDAMEAIASIYRENKVSQSINVDEFMEFEKIKDLIIPKILGMEDNEKFLSDKPFTQISDMAVVYSILMSNGVVPKMDHTIASIPIENNLMQKYGITVEQLHEAALANLPRLMPHTIQGMSEIMMNEMPEGVAEELGMVNISKEDEVMFVLSNERRINGAAVVISDDVMQSVRDHIGEDFYILPSSIHELLCVRNSNKDLPELENMVQEVNATQVRPDERLSDHVYKYDFDKKELYRADEEQRRQQEQSQQDNPDVIQHSRRRIGR